MQGFVWLCVLAILSVGPRFLDLAPGWCAGLGVRVRPRDIEDSSRWPVTLARWPCSGSLR